MPFCRTLKQQQYDKMLVELIIWTIFVAGTLLLLLWVLASPPPSKKIRNAPSNEDAYTKSRFLPGKVMKDPDVIVIGSGMGGNAVSSILSRFGKKVGLWEGGMVIFRK